MNFSQHGGEIREFCEEFQCSPDQALDFSGNLNPLGIPDSVEALFPSLVQELGRFSDLRARDFCQEAARHYPIWPENVISGNDVSDLISLAIRSLAPRRALIVEPSYTEYRRILNLQGTEVRSLLLKENEGFRFSMPQLLNAMMGVDLVILGHPNNPTGTGLERDELTTVLEEAKRRHVFVIVDESFCDWRPERSVAREVRDNCFFLVLRSLTYFYSLAGLRCGYGLGARKLIEKMKQRQEIRVTSSLAQRLAVEALRDQGYQEKSRDWFSEEQPWFLDRLVRLNGLKVYPSLANFTLLKLRAGLDGEELLRRLATEGMLLRGCNNFVGLDQSYIRVSLRLRQDNERLFNSLDSWFREHEGSLKAPMGH